MIKTFLGSTPASSSGRHISAKRYAHGFPWLALGFPRLHMAHDFSCPWYAPGFPRLALGFPRLRYARGFPRLAYAPGFPRLALGFPRLASSFLELTTMGLMRYFDLHLQIA